MRRVVSFLVVCAGLVACSDSPTEPSPTTVTSIVVTAPSPSLQVGEKVSATARLINSKGEDVTTKTASWSTSSAAVATVDQTGQITAVGPGVATITAQADKAKGTFPVTVDVDRCANPLSLAVGQVSLLSGPVAVSCITIASATAASQLLFITANGNSQPDEEQPFVVSLQTGTASSVSPAAALFGGGMSPELRRVADALQVRDNIETRIRQAEGRILRAMHPGRAAVSEP